MDEKTLVQARKRAEKAVVDMPEGELKVKAFEVILARLLSGLASESGERSDLNRHDAVQVPHKERPRERKLATSLADRIIVLREEGFFAEGRSISAIRDELRSHGWVYPLTSLSGALQSLVQKRELRRGFVSEGKKKGYKYVNP